MYPDTKRLKWKDSTYIGHLKESDTCRQRLEHWLRGFGRRNGELVFSGDRVSDGEDEKFCRRMAVMVAKPCEVYLEIIKTVNFILFYVMLFCHNKKNIYCWNEDIFLQCWVLLNSLQSTPKANCLSYREPPGSPSNDCMILSQLQPTLKGIFLAPELSVVVFRDLWGFILTDFSHPLPCCKEFAKPTKLKEHSSWDCLHFKHQLKGFQRFPVPPLFIQIRTSSHSIIL